ncbi:MAG: LysR family transcriptional regulator [Caulobacter sp.]|nr:LysR family transcriptional regulator [Caulobacter sp.]
MITKHFPFFLAAVEEQSFHKAADRLHIAQSALSRRIGDLELELGVTLFERQARGVRPTAAGRALAQDVRRILADVEQTARRTRRVAEGGLGLLRISFTEGMVRRPLLPAAIRRFRGEWPDVDLRFAPMVSEQQREKLRQGELEVGFVFEEGGDREEFELRDVGMHNFVLVLPLDHPLANAPSIRLADLANEKFIWPSRSMSPRLFNRMLAICQERDFTPDIVVEVASVDVAYSLVAAGMGVGVVITTHPGREPSDVALRKIEDFDVPMPLSMIWRRYNPSPVLANFVRSVEEAQAEQVETV